MKERNEGERDHVDTKSVDYLRKQNLSPVSHVNLKKKITLAHDQHLLCNPKKFILKPFY